MFWPRTNLAVIILTLNICVKEVYSYNETSEVTFEKKDGYTHAKAPIGKEVKLEINRPGAPSNPIFTVQKFTTPYVEIHGNSWQLVADRSRFNYIADPTNKKFTLVIKTAILDDSGVYFLQIVDRSTKKKFGDPEAYLLEVIKSCEDGWAHLWNHCYKQFENKDWLGAFGTCARLGAEIASAWSDSFTNDLLKLAEDHNDPSDPVKMWLGASDIAMHGRWVWGDGRSPVPMTPSSFVYSNWAPGHPKAEHPTNCMRMSNDGKWLSGACKSDKDYIYFCKKKSGFFYHWSYYNNSYYRHILAKQPDMRTSNEVCEEYGAHIATPKSREDLIWLAYLTRSVDQIHTNAIYDEQGARWFWDHNNEEVTWFDWIASDFLDKPEQFQEIGLTRVKENKKSTYKMFKIPLGSQLTFVCQRPTPKCNEGWLLIGKMCFYYLSKKVTWFWAQAVCRSWGGELATAKSLTKNHILVNLALSSPQSDREAIWLNGKRILPNGIFDWEYDFDLENSKWTNWEHVPSGWTCHNQKCRRYFSTTAYLNMEESRDKCSEEGGTLPRPRNEYENTLLMETPVTVELAVTQCWLDIRLNEEHKWIWQDGSMNEVAWTNWDQSSGDYGKCAQIILSTGKWVRQYCDKKVETFCERPQGPSSKTNRVEGCLQLNVKNGLWQDSECTSTASAVCEVPVTCEDKWHDSCSLSDSVWFCRLPRNKIDCCRTYARVCIGIPRLYPSPLPEWIGSSANEVKASWCHVVMVFFVWRVFIVSKMM